MKQKDWYWRGAAFFALAMFVVLQSIQEPLYSGAAGGLCALAAAILLGCGLRTETQEKSAREAERMETERQRQEAQRQTRAADLDRMQSILEALQKEIRSARESAEQEGQQQRERIAALEEHFRARFEAQQQSYTAALRQIQADVTTAAAEIPALRHAVTDESHSQAEALAQIAAAVRECSASAGLQAKEGAQALCNTILEQHAALRALLERQGKEAAAYDKFMISQPWPVIGDLSETLQSIADQTDSLGALVDEIHSDMGKQIKRALDPLKADLQSLQETMQGMCNTLEAQGKENRDAMDRAMQCYSDITAQDLEVLTALARDASL